MVVCSVFFVFMLVEIEIEVILLGIRWVGSLVFWVCWIIFCVSVNVGWFVWILLVIDFCVFFEVLVVFYCVSWFLSEIDLFVSIFGVWLLSFCISVLVMLLMVNGDCDVFLVIWVWKRICSKRLLSFLCSWLILLLWIVFNSL